MPVRARRSLGIEIFVHRSPTAPACCPVYVPSNPISFARSCLPKLIDNGSRASSIAPVTLAGSSLLLVRSPAANSVSNISSSLIIYSRCFLKIFIYLILTGVLYLRCDYLRLSNF